MYQDHPERDSTPYTPDQIELIRSGLDIVAGAWTEYDKEGVKIARRDGRFGDSWSLNVDGVDWMQTNPVDMLDHAAINGFHGRVLLTGLGLGVGVLFANANPAVTEIIVIERNQRVADAIVPMIGSRMVKPAFLLRDDADLFKSPPWPDAECAFLDHHEAAIPESVIQRYRDAIPNVICWFDEHERVKRAWQVQ